MTMKKKDKDAFCKEVDSVTSDKTVPKRVKYLGGMTYSVPPFIEGKIYDVISVEKGWYRIMTELDEDYLFPPRFFEIVE